jgi:hypothetical protein
VKHIPHNNHHKPGTWKGLMVPIDEIGKRYRKSASMTCPECGQISSLSGHDIADDGIVSPSVVCPYELCHFHEFIKLEGWDPV